MAFPKSVRSVEIEQQIKFGFTADVIEKFISEMKTTRYLYIQHGRNILDPDGNPIEDKEPHYHLYIWFKDPVPTQNILNKLKSLNCECGVQQLEKIKKDDSAVAYATHENCNKPTYPRAGVHANFEYNEIIDKEVKRKNAKRNIERANEILSLIDNGDIKEYNLHDKISIVEYNTYKKDIDNGFAYRANRLRNEVNREMKCIYICGDSGTGKTTYAKQIAKNNNYNVFVSSSSNDVLDGYGGQECVILDDLRPSALGLADLLKLLDNNTSSTVKSRYKNKILECKMIIVTSTLDIEQFFKNVFMEQPETVVQLKRRCLLYIKMTTENIKTYLYNEKTRQHEYIGTQDNFILLELKQDELSAEEKVKYVKSILGDTADMLKTVADKIDYEQLSISDILYVYENGTSCISEMLNCS